MSAFGSKADMPQSTLGSVTADETEGRGIFMKPLRATLIAAFITVLPVTGQAQYLDSANNVMKGCRAFLAKSKGDTFLRGVCAGTVHAIAGLALDSDLCIPTEATVGQEIQVVVTYIDARPDRQHQDFRSLALEALKEAWPCKPR